MGKHIVFVLIKFDILYFCNLSNLHKHYAKRFKIYYTRKNTLDTIYLLLKIKETKPKKYRPITSLPIYKKLTAVIADGICNHLEQNQTIYIN